jgi:hypothetical protein
MAGETTTSRRSGQLRRHSALETCLSTCIGFGVAYTANLIILPVFGYTPTWQENIVLTSFFTVVSLVRGYYVRRLFNWLHIRGIL